MQTNSCRSNVLNIHMSCWVVGSALCFLSCHPMLSRWSLFVIRLAVLWINHHLHLPYTLARLLYWLLRTNGSRNYLIVIVPVNCLLSSLEFGMSVCVVHVWRNANVDLPRTQTCYISSHMNSIVVAACVDCFRLYKCEPFQFFFAESQFS